VFIFILNVLNQTGLFLTDGKHAQLYPAVLNDVQMTHPAEFAYLAKISASYVGVKTIFKTQTTALGQFRHV